MMRPIFYLLRFLFSRSFSARSTSDVDCMQSLFVGRLIVPRAHSLLPSKSASGCFAENPTLSTRAQVQSSTMPCQSIRDAQKRLAESRSLSRACRISMGCGTPDQSLVLHRSPTYLVLSVLIADGNTHSSNFFALVGCDEVQFLGLIQQFIHQKSRFFSVVLQVCQYRWFDHGASDLLASMASLSPTARTPAGTSKSPGMPRNGTGSEKRKASSKIKQYGPSQ